MKRKTFSVTLVLLLLAGLVLATGAAGQEPEDVEISGFFVYEETYEIEPGQVPVIRAGWGACSPGLVRAFIGAIDFEVTLVDTTTNEKVLQLVPEDVAELWGEIEVFETLPPWQDGCVGAGRPARAEWRYAVHDLKPGEYELHTWWWLGHSLIDGGDLDADGRPDLFIPNEFNDNSFNWITVNE